MGQIPTEIDVTGQFAGLKAEIVMETDALVKSAQYDDAVDLIADALKVLPDSTLLSQKKAEVVRKKPKLFMRSFSPYEDRVYSAVVNGQSMEMAGKSISTDSQWEGIIGIQRMRFLI